MPSSAGGGQGGPRGSCSTFIPRQALLLRCTVMPISRLQNEGHSRTPNSLGIQGQPSKQYLMCLCHKRHLGFPKQALCFTTSLHNLHSFCLEHLFFTFPLIGILPTLVPESPSSKTFLNPPIQKEEFPPPRAQGFATTVLIMHLLR